MTIKVNTRLTVDIPGSTLIAALDEEVPKLLVAATV